MSAWSPFEDGYQDVLPRTKTACRLAGMCAVALEDVASGGGIPPGCSCSGWPPARSAAGSSLGLSRQVSRPSIHAVKLRMRLKAAVFCVGAGSGGDLRLWRLGWLLSIDLYRPPAVW
jgi:hypothetical protein